MLYAMTIYRCLCTRGMPAPLSLYKYYKNEPYHNYSADSINNFDLKGYMSVRMTVCFVAGKKTCLAVLKKRMREKNYTASRRLGFPITPFSKVT